MSEIKATENFYYYGIGWAGSRKRINYHGNSLKRPQSHGSLFEKSTAAGVLGEWLSASASRG